MFPKSSVAYLQTGFRTPEIYTVAMVSILHLGGSATREHIIMFYFATSLVVLLGTCSWWVVARSPKARACFAQKDAEAATARARAGALSSAADERMSLLKDTSASDTRYLSSGGHKGMEEEETMAHVAELIRPCRVAIFVNIWSSIFCAGFFAYVKPAGRIDTELVLYFVRLFSGNFQKVMASAMIFISHRA